MTKRIVVGLALFSAACGGGDQGGAPPGGAGGPPGRGGPPMAMPVDVAVARTDTVVETIRATGQIEATQSIDLRPEVEGRIVEIVVSEGREVAQGAVLFRIDDTQLRAQVARLEAERDLADQALKRTRELLDRNASSAADLERAEASARGAAASLEQQQLRLDRTVVRAPFAGVVGQRFVSLGDYVSSATRLTTLQTVDPQRAAFGVPERYAQQLVRGLEVTFMVAALADRTFTGVVDFVDPRVELPGRTITVKARVPNRGRVLKPGMFIEVALVAETRPRAVVVPEDAVLPVSGADYVWLVVEGKATRRQVTLGVREPGFVEVQKGVAAGEHVVVGGLERLFEGAPVQANQVERQ
jgi:membrane fusion protein (multidrug efflux system)